MGQRGAWWTTVHGVANEEGKGSDMTKRLTFSPFSLPFTTFTTLSKLMNHSELCLQKGDSDSYLGKLMFK